MDDRITRITEMEDRLNRVTAWLDEHTAPTDSVQEDIRVLDKYYSSPLWRSDFEADEAGELPADLPRGVLSEDGIYNALEECRERMKEQVSKTISGIISAGMIAPCGLNCAVCKRALAENDPCPGCNGPNKNKPVFCAEKCGIILCRKRIDNGYEYCDECPEYPCADVTEKENRYTSKYPLYESPKRNLSDIRALGMEQFIENERVKWTCKECGGVVSVHTGICSGCGKQYGAQVICINEDTWRIEDGMVRFFLLKGTEKALLIDSGMTVRHAGEIAAALTGLPVELLNTHSDRDHTGCNDRFEWFYMHPADEPQYRASEKSGRVVPINDGDEIDLGNRKLRMIHLPGHTPGSVAVLDISRRVLISGDPIQEHGRIFMFGKHRNMSDYINSLEKLEKMTDEFDEIWPSHADIPISPDCIGRLIDGAKRIQNRDIEGKTADFFGREITVYDLGFTSFLCEV